MTETQSSRTLPRESAWQVLLRLRWLLAGMIALAFALGQLVEALLLGAVVGQARLVVDVLLWGLLGGLAVWLSLTWASRQERRYQAVTERALDEQQRLNQQLQRINAQLALLRDVNQQLAESATLDEILDAALAFPQRLIAARAGALVLYDAERPVVVRTSQVGNSILAQLRLAFDLTDARADGIDALQIRALLMPTADLPEACLVLPLTDGQAALGRIELYVEHPMTLPEDERVLLETVASEIAEGITSARRRAREVRALYELEQAIAEERARISRDIHDGIAQTLAFRRMRIDLWLDWLTSDPARLRAELIELKHLLREQIADLRRAIFALRPIQFDEFGFVGGLHRYVVEFAGQHAWDVQVDLSGVPSDLPPELEAISFRVVQEALTNVAKHAHATRVAVQIAPEQRGLSIVVRDNGRGFDPEQVAASGAAHLGLRQMRERLTALRGQLLVRSQPGGGTEVRAWLPLAFEREGGQRDTNAAAARR